MQVGNLLKFYINNLIKIMAFKSNFNILKNKKIDNNYDEFRLQHLKNWRSPKKNLFLLIIFLVLLGIVCCSLWIKKQNLDEFYGIFQKSRRTFTKTISYKCTYKFKFYYITV